MNGGAILLTGASGQVGGALRPLLERLGPVSAPERAALDMADADAIRRAVRERRPALIVNAAAHTAVDKAESEPDLAMAVNGVAPGVLAEEARRARALLVHYSTDYVFDGKGTRPYVEIDPCAPLSVYGRSKRAGEAAILGAGCTCLILRTCWVYDARGRNFLNTIRRLMAERTELRIVDDQTGSPTWAAAIAAATARVLEMHWKNGGVDLGGRGGLYHLSAAGATTWCGFARAIVAAHGRSDVHVVPIATADYPTPARRPAWSVLDNTKFRDAFGFALPDWEVQLKSCLAKPT